MKISQVLREKGDYVAAIAQEDSVADALNLLVEKKIGAVVAEDGDGRISGVLSERDIIFGLSTYGESVLEKRVSELMSPQLHTCAPGDTMFKAMSMMTGRRVRHIPIVEEGELKGIVSVGDVVKARIAEIEQEAEALREYINSA
ncbi:MAG: CBS domain-containing protein [Pseudomonadota bacterium]|nr:CBS domain-containing protein [Pseudomonadota bacterium]